MNKMLTHIYKSQKGKIMKPMRRILLLTGLLSLLGALPTFSQENPKAEEWFTPARFGMFYSWGMFTGGGSSTTGSKKLPYFETADAFEKAVGSPKVFAQNLVGLTQKVGAKYFIITLMHSCERHMVIYPTQLPYFTQKTKKDYLGALIQEAHKKNIRIICYFPAHAGHYQTEGKPYITGLNGENPRSPKATEKFVQYLTELFTEMRERYGENAIDGFWMDGFTSWEPVLKSFPNALRIGNNHLSFSGNPPSDICAAEFTTGPCDPPYNRPSGLIKPNLHWGDNHLAPRKDYVEDIPTCNGWWFHGGTTQNQYTQDSTFWVKQMLCDIGIRRKWNHSMGFGPQVDGTAPPEFEPMVKTMSEFMAWAHPGIYNTTGGEGAPIQGQWLNSGAFGVVTVSSKDPKTCYLFVLEPPTKFTKSTLKVQHDRVEVASITDLHTGKPLPFRMNGAIEITINDWSDLEKYGAKGIVIHLK
jgi:hypothetical protein